MRSFLQTYAQTLWDTHVQMGHMHVEFQQWLDIHTAEELMRLSPRVGPSTERQGPVESQECNSATMMEGLKKRTKLTFGIKRKDKDSESTGSQDADQTTPEVDDEGYSIRPEIELNDPKTNCFYSSSDSEEEARGGKAGGGGGGGGDGGGGGGGRRRRRRLYVEIKPPEEAVGGPDPTAAAQELRASICNIALPPSPAIALKKGAAHNEDIVRQRRSTPTPPPLAVAAVTANQLFPSDPLFGPPLEAIPQAFATEAGNSQSDIWGARPPQAPPEGTASPQTPPQLGSPPRPPASTPPPLPDGGPPEDEGPPASPVAVGGGGPQEAPVITAAGGGAPSLGGDEAPTRSSETPTETDGGAPDKPPSPDEAQRTATVEPCASPSEPEGKAETPPAAGGVATNPEGPTAAAASPRPPGEAAGAEGTAAAEPALAAEPGGPTRDSEATPAEPQIVVQSPVAPPTMADSAPASPLPLSIRQKIPPTKLYSDIQKRPFSPPPGLAPLARAESTSSISSNASASNATTPTVDFDQLKMVWFDRGKFYFTFEGASRGPSPLTLGAHDTLPVAAAFTETVNAYFRAAEQCMVKITGEPTISFPSGITKVFSGNPSPAVLSFRLRNSARLEQLLPNPQLLYSDLSQSDSETRDFWLNMPALCSYLKKLSEQSPSATYYNVDILKYQVSAGGADAAPLLLEPSWRCEDARTSLRVAFRYNGSAMASPSPITNLQVVTPVGGGATDMQATPPATWNAEQNWVLWKIPEISEKSEGGGSGVLQAHFSVADGPTVPATLAAQFVSEGSSLSGVEFELVGGGYRLSLVKKRFATGKYMADG
ncbi:SH3-containing GRB2-like protein 3-interacting protein 1 isoform X1 [Lethenteron reissneri]|uniref:SH3-containing GRB2-like protein 3-interacting protein 1 isoform X1 n=1 Tax=Lethenteron reissneri TaxID=7753 RepID=UPI002AB6853B|nr:SH3-containing GRB2-like protein 3-interacting protein 1 isoform X1 [Lethenteron reissneri]